MAKKYFAILSVSLLFSQVILAACETSDIPGHYNDRYTDKNDGTVIDHMTNLMWMKCDVDVPWNPAKGICQENDQVAGSGRIKYTWQEALNKTQQANAEMLTEYSDWRLPNIKELASIMALHCLNSQNTALDSDFFPGASNEYWSSTPYRIPTEVLNDQMPINQAWKVSYKGDGLIGARPSTIDQLFTVRLVRN